MFIKKALKLRVVIFYIIESLGLVKLDILKYYEDGSGAFISICRYKRLIPVKVFRG